MPVCRAIQQQSVGNPLPKASPSNSEAWCRQSNGKSNLHGKLSIQDLLWSCVLSSAFGEKLNGEKHVVQKNHSLHKSHFCGLDGRLLRSLERGSYPKNSTGTIAVTTAEWTSQEQSIVCRNVKSVCSQHLWNQLCPYNIFIHLDVIRIPTCLVFCTPIFQGATAILVSWFLLILYIII